jgi:hypothetical protein
LGLFAKQADTNNNLFINLIDKNPDQGVFRLASNRSALTSTASPWQRGRHPRTTESRCAGGITAPGGLDSFDIHSLDKIEPKQLNQAVAVWSAFTYLAVASDVYFRSLAPTAN